MKVPCHRVVASSRELHGFQGSTDANGSCLRKKKEMLLEEGVIFESSEETDAPSSTKTGGTNGKKRKLESHGSTAVDKVSLKSMHYF